VRVGWGGRGCGDAVDAAGHAEVEDEGLIIIRAAEKPFTVAKGLDEAMSDELFKMGGLWSDEIGAANMHGDDRHIQNVRLQGAADFFNFGEFRHRKRL